MKNSGGKTTVKVLYHGSPNDFRRFDSRTIRRSSILGYGFYLTNAPEVAEWYCGRHGEYDVGFIYKVKCQLGRPLSVENLTLSRNTVTDIVIQIEKQTPLVEGVSNLSLENESTALRRAVEYLMSKISDLDIFNELITRTGTPALVVQTFRNHGYNYAIKSQEHDDIYVFFDERDLHINFQRQIIV